MTEIEISDASLEIRRTFAASRDVCIRWETTEKITSRGFVQNDIR